MSARVVLCSFPSEDAAAAVARTLVDEQLAACVTIVPGARSIYRWQGAIEDAREVLALIKTSASRYAALEARLVALHPYAVPEVLAVDVASGHAPYLEWLAAAVADRS